MDGNHRIIVLTIWDDIHLPLCVSICMKIHTQPSTHTQQRSITVCSSCYALLALLLLPHSFVAFHAAGFLFKLELNKSIKLRLYRGLSPGVNSRILHRGFEWRKAVYNSDSKMSGYPLVPSALQFPYHCFSRQDNQTHFSASRQW